MIDGKMQDDATWKQCKVMVNLAKMLAAKDPELEGGVRVLRRSGRCGSRASASSSPDRPRESAGTRRILCAREGARVCVHGRDAGRGAAVVRTITDAGGAAVFLAADLADEAACGTLVDAAAERLGGLTVLVNNAAAGSGGRSPAGAFDTAVWERVLRVNLTASRGSAVPPSRTCSAPATASIVNISSRQAERASAGLAPYVASKGGLNALTRSIAVEYGRAGASAATRSPSATS